MEANKKSAYKNITFWFIVGVLLLAIVGVIIFIAYSGFRRGMQGGF